MSRRRSRTTPRNHFFQILLLVVVVVVEVSSPVLSFYYPRTLVLTLYPLMVSLTTPVLSFYFGSVLWDTWSPQHDIILGVAFFGTPGHFSHFAITFDGIDSESSFSVCFFFWDTRSECWLFTCFPRT